MVHPQEPPKKVRCPCGAVLSLPAGAAGRRLRCPKCGREFRVGGAFSPTAAPASAAAPTADRHRLELADGEVCPQCRARLAAGGIVCPRCGYNLQTKTFADPTQDESPPPPARSQISDRGGEGFWPQALYSFLCFADPQNMVVLLIAAGIAALGGVVGLAPLCWGAIARFIVYGWLCSFYVNVLLHTASGEDELPRITLIEGWYEGILQPAVLFIASMLVVQLPAIIVGVYVGATGGFVAEIVSAIDLLRAGMLPMGIGLWFALTLLGAFCWPSVILLMSMSSAWGLFRVDLWVRTIARTLPAYASICALLAVVFVLQIAGFLLAGGAFSLGAAASGAGLQIVGAVITTYGWVVTMRIIGLYYRHYKSRFPWTAE